MKRFFAVCFVFVVAVVATFTFTVKAEAGDVPDFCQVNEYNFYYGDRGSAKQGYNYYDYGCSVNLDEDFAECYVNYLTQYYPFEVTRHFVNDFTDLDDSQYVETWVLSYYGPKYAEPFRTYNVAHIRDKFDCHVKVSRHQYFSQGRTSFHICVANDLIYEGD